MVDIKLFVCCHQPDFVPAHVLLRPIQVGAALAPTRFEGYIHDDIGDNISAKNRSYCELTAQYWAWKNVVADYYGFFHYRRYLYPDCDTSRPYRVEKTPSIEKLNQLGYDRFADCIAKYDLIAPKGENMRMSVRTHYAAAPHHYGKDLALAEQIISETNPEMTGAAEAYLSNTVCYFGNIYIMKRQMFFDYCAWLFPILQMFDKRATLAGYSAQALRVNGYLAERLFGIYLTYIRQSERLRIAELPRVHFEGMNGGSFYGKKLAAAALPPNSRRRAFAKQMIKGSGGV